MPQDPARRLRTTFAIVAAAYLLPLTAMVLLRLGKAVLVADPSHAVGTGAQLRFWAVIVLTVACVGSVAALGHLVHGSWKHGGAWLVARPFWLKAIALLAPAVYFYAFVDYLLRTFASQRLHGSEALVPDYFWSTHYMIGAGGLAWTLLIVVAVGLARRLRASTGVDAGSDGGVDATTPMPGT